LASSGACATWRRLARNRRLLHRARQNLRIGLAKVSRSGWVDQGEISVSFDTCDPKIIKIKLAHVRLTVIMESGPSAQVRWIIHGQGDPTMQSRAGRGLSLSNPADQFRAPGPAHGQALLPSVRRFSQEGSTCGVLNKIEWIPRWSVVLDVASRPRTNGRVTRGRVALRDFSGSPIGAIGRPGPIR